MCFTISAYCQTIPSDIDTQIRKWVKETYDLESYGSSAQKMMYQEEVKNYIWLSKNAKDKDTLRRVMNMYPPTDMGYSALKMMYEEEIKNNNW